MKDDVYSDENLYRLFSNKLIAQLYRTYADCREDTRTDDEINRVIKFLNYYTTQCTTRPSEDAPK